MKKYWNVMILVIIAISLISWMLIPYEDGEQAYEVMAIEENAQ